MVRAFAAAGIANRIVAICDNDTAASDALRSISSTALPPNIRIIQYPELDFAKTYPTLGPPIADGQQSSSAVADVNGLAASIELYLGRDTLMRADGSLRPVRWKAFIPGVGRYQGEVTEKAEIHKAFRTKAREARSNRSAISSQDWEGIRLILDALLSAFFSQP